MRGNNNNCSIRANSSPLARLRAAQRRQALPRMHQACSTAMERLESRQLMSVVSNSSDSGSLREAILDANANPGSTITFDSTVNLIQPANPLPAITATTTIKATGHSVVIDGTNVSGDGLDVGGANSILDGLVIVNFTT